MIELREREHGAQAEAARPLLARDGDGGLEGFLSRCGVGGTAPEQHFAANAVQLGFEGAMTSPFGRRQRVVEDGDSAVDIVGASFRFGEGNLDQPIEHHNILIAQELGAATHVLEPVYRLAGLSPRRALEEHPERPPHRQIMLTRDSRKFDGV